MIHDGTAGTRDGDGRAQCLNAAGRSDVSANYRAARMYNSGDIPGDLNSDGTRCYANNIANRLTSWLNAGSKCNLQVEILADNQGPSLSEFLNHGKNITRCITIIHVLALYFVNITSEYEPSRTQLLYILNLN